MSKFWRYVDTWKAKCYECMAVVETEFTEYRKAEDPADEKPMNWLCPVCGELLESMWLEASRIEEVFDPKSTTGPASDA